MDLIGAIIPTFNRKESLRRCLQCLQAQVQEGASWSLAVIAVVDGSTDGTLDMLDFFIETTRPTLERVRQALDAGDREEARAAAHSAAGVARTAGAKLLAAACTALERAIVEGRDADLSNHAQAMAAAFPEVEKAIHALRHTKETVSSPEETMV